uniref:DNA alkylation repair protein n=1 Tax=Anaerolinea thermolimosa TaxID=229919 RepID=A0A7C4PLQ7_9CHLR
MPAIQLSRLRDVLGQLFSLIDRPEQFHRALADFLEQQADHAYRAGENIPTRPRTPAYHIPPLVIRQLELEFTDACKRQPDALFPIADHLWQDPHLELRHLAAHILGQMPSSHLQGVVDRLRTWALTCDDRSALNPLLERATVSLRRDSPLEMVALLEGWLQGTDTLHLRIGLRVIEWLVQDSQFENLPALFRLLGPLVKKPTTPIFNNLARALQAVARRSGGETTFFLRQMLASSSNPSTARLARQVLPELSESQQQTLRASLRNQNPL